MCSVLFPGVVIVVLRLLRVGDGVLASEDRRGGVDPSFGDVRGGDAAERETGIMLRNDMGA